MPGSIAPTERSFRKRSCPPDPRTTIRTIGSGHGLFIEPLTAANGNEQPSQWTDDDATLRGCCRHRQHPSKPVVHLSAQQRRVRTRKLGGWGDSMTANPVEWVSLVDFGRKVVKMVPPGSPWWLIVFSWFYLNLIVRATPTKKTGRFQNPEPDPKKVRF